MTTYNDKSKDVRGREFHPVLFNTAHDGSGTWYFAEVDSSGFLKVVLQAGTAGAGKIDHTVTTIGEGRQIAGTAGTRVALASSTSAKIVIITAETDNTDYVAVAGSTVIEADATRTGTPLAAGDSVTLLVDDLADVYIDVAVNDEGVTYTYLN